MTSRFDVAFDSIAAAIGDCTRRPFVVASAKPVGGGSIHRAWHLTDGARHFFVKTGEIAAAKMFSAEAQGLKALSAAAVVSTPTFITLGQNATGAFLVLEYLDLEPLNPSAGAILGAAMAQLHRFTGESFGWAEDNFIGLSSQRNTPHPSWPCYFGEHRLRPQLQVAQQNGMERALVTKGYGIIELIGGLFLDHRPVPSLLHGDLWSGNAAQIGVDSPVIFDPACYYGDRETDIAMAELFGGFPTSFYAAYRLEWPLDAGYEARKPLYNLYHVLNHFNLFGSAYLGQAQRMIEGLLTTLKR